MVAGLLQLGSCLSYVLVFRAVFCQRMQWRTSYEIGMSELAANALLSVGGAGGLALGVWILRRGGMDTGHIARRTVAFFLLTSLANVTFLFLAGIGLATGALAGTDDLALALVPAAAGIGAIAIALLVRTGAGVLADRRLHALRRRNASGRASLRSASRYRPWASCSSPIWSASSAT